STLNMPNQLRAHVNGALNHGLTPEELYEIVAHVAGYSGFPRGIEAMTVVNADGAAVFARLTGRDEASDPEAMLAVLEEQLGPIGTAAIEFAFGDIWARPQLSRRD